MNGNGEQSNSWKSVIDSKAHLLYQQIAQIQSQMSALGTDANTIEMMCQPYYDLLENLFTDDYPLASALENSDLVVRLAGSGINADSPRLSVITSYFGKVKKQVTRLAKEIADIQNSGRKIPREFDLTLSAYAKGSIVLGFSLPTLEDLEDREQTSLFGVEDPLYKAAREAMKTLGLVSHFVAEAAPIEVIAAAVPDAKIRDVALSAIHDLSPSGQMGISTVSIGGKDIGEFDEGTLTKENRKAVRQVLEHPVVSSEVVAFPGQVREMDLDAKRFDLRHVEDLTLNEVRCVYNEKQYTDAQASAWLNRSVIVHGIVERDANGKARLMEVIKVES